MNPITFLDGSMGESSSLETLLVYLMLAVSVALVAIAVERAIYLVLVRRSLKEARAVIDAARSDDLSKARQVCQGLEGPAPKVLSAGLDRELGEIRGDAARGMLRAQKQLAGSLKNRTWILGTAGALMPFVGLFGTVLGVMASFQAIGESGQGGFAIVSVGISQALIATAVGIAVALEGVILFNILQNAVRLISADLSMLVDEMLELIVVSREEHAVDTGS